MESLLASICVNLFAYSGVTKIELQASNRVLKRGRQRSREDDVDDDGDDNENDQEDEKAKKRV